VIELIWKVELLKGENQRELYGICEINCYGGLKEKNMFLKMNFFSLLLLILSSFYIYLDEKFKLCPTKRSHKFGYLFLIICNYDYSRNVVHNMIFD